MELSDSSFSEVAFAMQRPNQQAEADRRLLVRFSLEPMLNEEKSSVEGRPIYDETEFVTIMVPGDRDNIVIRPVNEQDRQRFPQQYAHWKNTGQQAETGTPISAAPWMNRAQVEELRHFNVRTIEQLANLSDGNAAKFAGIQLLKQKAQAYLAAAAGGAPLEKMQSELNKRDNEIATLKKMVEEQGKALDRLQANKKQL
jgi:hypothetical protein